MITEELEKLLELKVLSNELRIAINFAEAKNGLTQPTVKMTGNFEAYFEAYLSKEMSANIITDCIARLKAKKLEVDREIRNTVVDWAG